MVSLNLHPNYASNFGFMSSSLVSIIDYSYTFSYKLVSPFMASRILHLDHTFGFGFPSIPNYTSLRLFILSCCSLLLPSPLVLFQVLMALLVVRLIVLVLLFKLMWLELFFIDLLSALPT